MHVCSQQIYLPLEGVGKGRQIAGLILEHSLTGGKRCLWISTSNDLRYDAVRDLSDVGARQIHVWPEVQLRGYSRTFLIQLLNFPWHHLSKTIKSSKVITIALTILLDVLEYCSFCITIDVTTNKVVVDKCYTPAG